MISAETPYLFSRACEMLVLDLTLRSWLHTEDCNRRTLQKGDIVTAVDHSADMDFLLDVLPKEPTEIQGHVCEPESITPFMAARPDLVSDLLTYDPPKSLGVGGLTT
ncbi:Nuclear transcription factor Y subunit C-3 [Nymphaea thermarum]|nr:Nuclear transcription factor Y subunit C-3 [Nymphaea thermarum]